MVLYPQILRGRRVPWGTYNRSARVGQREGDSRLPCGFHEPGQGRAQAAESEGHHRSSHLRSSQVFSPQVITGLLTLEPGGSSPTGSESSQDPWVSGALDGAGTTDSGWPD